MTRRTGEPISLPSEATFVPLERVHTELFIISGCTYRCINSFMVPTCSYFLQISLPLNMSPKVLGKYLVSIVFAERYRKSPYLFKIDKRKTESEIL